MFIDEYTIYRSSRAQSVSFWAKDNSHYYEEIEYKTPDVMMRAVLNARHVIGPHFFDGPVNHTSYLNMLQQWFIPKLNEIGNKEKIYFQQNGAPAHCAFSVREYLNDTFLDKWIGCGSITLPTPIELPAKSQDLTTCDNSLWEYIENVVPLQKRYHSNNELEAAITAAFGTISLVMLNNNVS